MHLLVLRGCACGRAYSTVPPFNFPLKPYCPPVYNSISLNELMPVRVPTPTKLHKYHQNHPLFDNILLPSTSSNHTEIYESPSDPILNQLQEIMRTLPGRRVTITELKLQGYFIQPELTLDEIEIRKSCTKSDEIGSNDDFASVTSLVPYSSALPDFLMPYSVLFSEFNFTSESPEKPSNDKLLYIASVLQDQLPKQLSVNEPISYDMYRNDVILVDNIRGTIARGKQSYVTQIAFMKTLLFCTTVKSRMAILSVNTMHEDSTIRVRWRIVYKKYIDWFLNRTEDRWFDAFSVFHVDDEGYIFKHVVDKPCVCDWMLLSDPVAVPHCQKGALTSQFALVIQGVLAWLALMCLVVKRLVEPVHVRRAWTIWFLDASKQGIGMAVIHLLNVLLAQSFKGDPCTWYIVSFVLDSTVGLVVIYILVNLLSALARYFCWTNLHFGEYGRPPCCKAWIFQSIAFVLIIVIVKLVVTIIIQSFEFWADVRKLILWPINSQRVELIMVMLVIPFTLNTFMFWMTDNFVKRKDTKADIHKNFELGLFDESHLAVGRESHMTVANNCDVLLKLLDTESEHHL